MRKATAIIALLVVGVVLVSAVPNDASTKHFNHGVQLQKQGDLQGARKAYEAALEIVPNRVDALANLGLVHYRLGQLNLAAQRFRQALEIRPDMPRVRLTLGVAYFQLGEYEGARREAERVVREEPANANAHRLLGISLLKDEKISEGISSLETALELKPGDEEITYTLAIAYVNAGQPELAEKLLDKEPKDSETAEAHLVRGAIYEARQQYLEAITELNTARRLKPELTLIYEMLGKTYAHAGDFERAKESLRRVLESEPDDVYANVNLGWMAIQHRLYEEAAAYVRKAYELRPDSPEVVYMLGQLEQVEGNYEKARVLLDKVVEARPNYRPAHVLLARVYVKLGMREEFAREKAVIRKLTEEQRHRETAPSRAGRPAISGGAPAPETGR